MTDDFKEALAELRTRLAHQRAEIERQRLRAARKARWWFAASAVVLFVGMAAVAVLHAIGV